MPVTHLSGRHSRVDVSLDGITITHSQRRADRQVFPRSRHVAWEDVLAATLQRSRKGRPVIRLAVAGETAPDHHRSDPLAVKLRRTELHSAQELVQHINAEVEIRHRWRQAADSQEHAVPAAGHLIAPAEWDAHAAQQIRT